MRGIDGIHTGHLVLQPRRRVRAVVNREAEKAKLVTATNVFAHIEDIHSVVEAVLELLDEDGLFITESHYLLSLVETLQYDTIYHEHLRYYSLGQSQAPAGDARPGGDPRPADPDARRLDPRLRAARKGQRTRCARKCRRAPRAGAKPKADLRRAGWKSFRDRVVLTKMGSLHALLQADQGTGRTGPYAHRAPRRGPVP